MKRWSRAFPGAIKVTHSLGNFKSEQAAYAAYEEKVLSLAVGLPEDQVHPRLRSAGYGASRKFWGELHFATIELGEDHAAKNGGEAWYCVGLYGESDEVGRDADRTIQEWLKVHAENTGEGAPLIKQDVVGNYGSKLISDEDSPSAYIYINNADVAMMLKLALGGKA